MERQMPHGRSTIRIMFRIMTVSVLLLTSVPAVGDDATPRFLDKQTYTLQLTNGTRLTGQVEHRDTNHIRVRTDDDFAITVPVPRIHEVARLDGRNRQVLHPLLQKDKRTRVKTIALGTKHKVTIRKNPTTQVRIRVVEWPDQTFLLWFPELVNNLWEQWGSGRCETGLRDRRQRGAGVVAHG